ncbi:hypothetical protein AB0D91_46240 [Streptomyces canus]
MTSSNSRTGVRQLVTVPLVLLWDRLSTHVSHEMRGLVTEREWPKAFRSMGAHQRGLADLAVVSLDRLEALVRNDTNASGAAPTPSTAS